MSMKIPPSGSESQPPVVVDPPRSLLSGSERTRGLAAQNLTPQLPPDRKGRKGLNPTPYPTTTAAKTNTTFWKIF